MLSATVEDSSRVIPSRSLMIFTVTSHVSPLHKSTPFSLMVTASPVAQTPPAGSDSTTIQAPIVSPGPAQDTDAAPPIESLTPTFAQLISAP